MPAETDRELLSLIERAQRDEGAGSAEAREELVRRTQGLVTRYLIARTRSFRRVPSDDDVQDIAQEAYFDAFRSLRTYKPELATFASWLCSIALRQGFKWLKRANRHAGAYSLDEQPDEGEAPYPEPASPGHLLIEQRLVLKDLLRFMAEAIETLHNADYRLVVGLLFTGWYTLGEVRDVLDWNINTLKSAFRRGFAEVKARISMRAGPVYAQMAEALMTTHKKSTLAKGMSVLDTDTLDRVDDPVTRGVLRMRLLEDRSEAQAAEALHIPPAETRQRLFDGVTELVKVVRETL